jgi:hypothetical protein
VSQNPPSNPETTILGTFTSILGLLSAALFFTGWIYRWAYFGFFQLEVTTLDLPFESFLFVPIQVFLGSFPVFCRTMVVVILTALLIKLTLRAIEWLSIKLTKNPNQSGTSTPQPGQKRNRRRVGRIARSLLNETIIVIWILVALFLFARWQGIADARLDAINDTSNLPVVTVLFTAEKNIALGRQLADLSTDPPLEDIRIIGDKALFDQLRGRETNDTTDPENPRVWRLLINRGGQLYVFKALHKNASDKERPLVLSISEKQLLILSPEAIKQR